MTNSIEIISEKEISKDLSNLLQQANNYKARKDYEKVLFCYIKAIKIKPANSKLYQKLAKFLVQEEKNYKIDITKFSQFNFTPHFYQKMGDAFNNLGKLDSFITYYDRAIQINPKLSEDLLPIMQNVRLRQNNYDLALELYQRWIENYYIVNHEHKIIYCPIPKNACSFLKILLVNNSKYKLDFKNSRKLNVGVHQYIRQNNKLKLGEFSYLSNPDYLKIAIIRNPFDRLVSGYLDKFVVGAEKAPLLVRNVIKNVYEFFDSKPDYDKSITFENFVDYLSRTEDCYLDKHWRSQFSFLGRELFQFDILDSLDNFDKVLKLLEQRIEVKIRNRKTGNKNYYGEHPSNSSWHQLYPQELAKLKKLPKANLFYTPKLLNLVENRYKSDLEIYNNTIS